MSESKTYVFTTLLSPVILCRPPKICNSYSPLISTLWTFTPLHSILAEESKRYIALQSLKKHKESCCGSKMIKSSNAKQCCKCDFKVKEFLQMKRHMRDVHDVITGSTSPPPKRKRKISDEFKNLNEPMDTEVDNVKDISFRLEDMDIDSSESEIESEKVD